MKLTDAIDGFWIVRNLEIAKTTKQTYTHYFNNLLRFFDDPDTVFEKITSDDVRKFLAWLMDERGVSKRTVHDHWIALSSLWTWAEKELDLPHIIRGKVQRPKFNKAMIEPLTKDEINAILKAVSSKTTKRTNGTVYKSARSSAVRDRALVLTLLDTGLRASELCALTIADYDQDRGKLHVRHGKGDKQRLVYLGGSSKKALWRYLMTRKNPKPNDALFENRAGKPFDRSSLARMMKRIGKEAGVKKANPHVYRHTFAINALRNGMSLKTLMEILGHTSSEVTSLYLKLSEIDLEQAIQHSVVDNWKL